MTVLAPMRPEDFDSFAQLSVAGYAEDNVSAGRWESEGALDRARSDFSRLLPQGMATPDHFFYEIREAGEDRAIGFIWFAAVADRHSRSGYLYNIRIKQQYRGRGHAKAALGLLDEIARTKGLASIALHTFSHNGAAQALYRSHGYWTTGVNMRKVLRESDA